MWLCVGVALRVGPVNIQLCRQCARLSLRDSGCRAPWLCMQGLACGGLSVCLRVCLHVCACVCVWMCMRLLCVCVRVRVRVCVRLWVCGCVYLCAPASACLWFAVERICVWGFVCVGICSCQLVCVHVTLCCVCVGEYAGVCARMCVRACVGCQPPTQLNGATTPVRLSSTGLASKQSAVRRCTCGTKPQATRLCDVMRELDLPGGFTVLLSAAAVKWPARS